jgi:hypothetical protein
MDNTNKEYRNAWRQAIFVGPLAFANHVVLGSPDLDRHFEGPGPIDDRGVIYGLRRTPRAELGLSAAAAKSELSRARKHFSGHCSAHRNSVFK